MVERNPFFNLAKSKMEKPTVSIGIFDFKKQIVKAYFQGKSEKDFLVKSILFHHQVTLRDDGIILNPLERIVYCVLKKSQ